MFKLSMFKISIFKISMFKILMLNSRLSLKSILKSRTQNLASFEFIWLLFGLVCLIGCTPDQKPNSVDPQKAKPNIRDVLPMPGEVLPMPGATKKDDLVSSYMKTMNQSPLEAFNTQQDQPTYDPLPQSWLKALKKLKNRASLKVKVPQWSYGISAYARHKPLRMGTLQISILGPITQAKQGLKSILNQVRLPQIPQKLTLKNQGKSKKMKWSLVGNQVGQGTQSVSNWVLEWQDLIPSPPSPLPNCRRIHALPPFTGFESWTHFGFKSGSIKRLMAYSVEQKENQAEWFFTILFRNGEKRDLGIGKWRDQVEKQGARLVQQKNMRLLWKWGASSTSLRELEWWSEKDPESMGCDLVSPLLGMRWLRTSSL